MKLRTLLLLALLAAAGLGRAFAQGGPPLVTDDPGTPGANQWEINLAWTTQRVPGSTLVGLPLLDANYGLGDRIELTYESPWEFLRDDDGTHDGAGDSLIGAKYRFYDAGDTGLQASVYPQYTFLDPDSHADRRGLADSASTLFLPCEFEKDLGPVSLDGEFGHVFSGHAADEGWMGGIILGRNIVKGWEVDVETHVDASEQLDRAEWLINFGTRINITEHVILLLALGRDLRDQLGPRTTLLSYCGVQLLF